MPDGSYIYSTRAYLILCGCMAFLLPIYQGILPWIIALLLLFFIFSGSVVNSFKRLAEHRLALLLVLFFLVHLIGLTYSKNQAFGWNDVSLKLGLLLFPVLLAYSGFDPRKTTLTAQKYFVYGSLVAGLAILLHAVVLYWKGHPASFHYDSLSWYMHPSYLSLYINFSLVILLFNTKWELKPVVRMVGALFFSVLVVLIASKAGILFCLLTWLIYLGRNLALFRNRMVWILSACLLAVSVYMFRHDLLMSDNNRFKYLQESVERSKIDKTTVESTAVRILIWDAAVKIISKQPLWGVGTGDVKDELVSQYHDEGMTGATRLRLNAHNQFLQTGVALGSLGILTLLASLLVPLFYALRCGYSLYTFFLLLVLFNLMFESMLERQAGILFYAFFNSLFIFSMGKPGNE